MNPRYCYGPVVVLKQRGDKTYETPGYYEYNSGDYALVCFGDPAKDELKKVAFKYIRLAECYRYRRKRTKELVKLTRKHWKPSPGYEIAIDEGTLLSYEAS